jgi:hypothetical protein
MNDIDQEVRRQLRELIDPEPVDTDRALRFVRASGSAHREVRLRRIPLVALAGLAALAVLVTTVVATTSEQQATPPYRLVGAAGAEVVVRIDSSGGQAPTATLTVGDTTIQGTEIEGSSQTPGGISFGTAVNLPSIEPPSEPSADVPDGSTLLVEGTFDTASASSMTWMFTSSDETGEVDELNVGTWQLDSSGGSVVFSGHDGDRLYLIVQATIGYDEHFFFFPIRISAVAS